MTSVAPAGPTGAATPEELVEQASLALMEMTLTALAADPDVSALQLRVLLAIDLHGPHNLSSLARRLGLSPPSASRLVDRMDEAGLLARKPARHSRREVVLAPTAKGRRVLARLRAARRSGIQAVLAGMSSQDGRALTHGLQAFSQAVEAAGPTG